MQKTIVLGAFLAVALLGTALAEQPKSTLDGVAIDRSGVIHTHGRVDIKNSRIEGREGRKPAMVPDLDR